MKKNHNFTQQKFKLNGMLIVTSLSSNYCRDIQASSILLDDKCKVQLGSLSEACVQEGDTHQSKISWFLRLPQ